MTRLALSPVRVTTAEPLEPVVAVPMTAPAEPAFMVNCAPGSDGHFVGTSVVGSTRTVWYDLSSSAPCPTVSSDDCGFRLAGTTLYAGQRYRRNVMSTLDTATVAGVSAVGAGLLGAELANAGPTSAASQKAMTAMTPIAVRPREPCEVRNATIPYPDACEP